MGWEGQRTKWTRYFDDIGLEDIHIIDSFLLTDFIALIMNAFAFFILFKTINQSYNEQSDFIPYKPKWLKEWRLGFRRLLSIPINLLLLLEIGGLATIAILCFLNEDNVFNIVSLTKINIIVIGLFYSFWIMVILLGRLFVNLTKWLKAGFN